MVILATLTDANIRKSMHVRDVRKRMRPRTGRASASILPTRLKTQTQFLMSLRSLQTRKPH